MMRSNTWTPGREQPAMRPQLACPLSLKGGDPRGGAHLANDALAAVLLDEVSEDVSRRNSGRALRARDSLSTNFELSPPTATRRSARSIDTGLPEEAVLEGARGIAGRGRRHAQGLSSAC